MSRFPRIHLFLAAMLVMFAAGCSDRQKSAAAATPTQVNREARIVVPPEVQGRWKAVKIAVLDKETTRETDYIVELGSFFRIKGSSLTVKVLHFLPAFIMDGTTMTSASNEPRNPAAQVEVRDGDKVIFKGWLFSLYPGAHPFQHPRYSYTLVDFIPARKK